MADDRKNPPNMLARIASSGELPTTTGQAAGGMRFPKMGMPPPKGSLESNALLKVFGRPVVQGLYYNNKTISLDGFRFVGCRFDNCTLNVSSTSFELINCVIDPQTVISYGNETIKIVRLFNSRTDWLYEAAPGLVPVKNADGTITISDPHQ